MRTAAIIVALATVALAGGYWFATGGRPAEAPPGWLTERPFAHRGLHDSPERPENSLAAFSAAAEQGHPIEIDVRLTADGTVVVFHDDDLERLTGDPRELAEVSYAELATLRLADTDEPIPTLAEVLSEVDGRVPLLVEIKNRGAVGPLEDAVAEQLARYEGDIAVMSFNPYSLARIAETEPQLVRGQLSGTFSGEDLPAYQVFALRQLLMNWTSRPHFVAYEVDGMPSLATRVQRLRGRPLLAWTAKDPETFRRASELADNVICDPGGLPR